jgi:intein/homing endonuclease
LNGYKKIEDIVLGDFVLTHLGSFKKVVGVKTYENKDTLIKFSTSKGEISVTPDHRVLVDRDGKVEWRRADEIKITDKLLRIS